MQPPAPKTSSRLVKAAQAERSELDRHRDRLQRRQVSLQAELAQVDAALVEVEERVALLDRIAPAADIVIEAANATKPDDADAGTASRPQLRGTAIRETAVRLVADRPEGARPLHYKDWFALLGDAGYSVAGKDPLATFLTQINRSPVVRKTTQAGVYEIDRDAPARLRRRLAQLQADLRAVTGSPAATEDLAEIRRRREQVLSEIAQIERALEEADRVLHGSTDSPAGGPVRSVA